MAQYRIYQRDKITGHMNLVSFLECRSNEEAEEAGRQCARGTETLVCLDGTVVARFPASLYKMAS